MASLGPTDLKKVTAKLIEFMQYTQRLDLGDSYLIINRDSPALTKAALLAAENYGLVVGKPFILHRNSPYKSFPKSLLKRLREKTPNGGIGFFDYSEHPEWELAEVGARIELLRRTIEQVPTRWGHAPGITIDMAVNGALQGDYKTMAGDAEVLQGYLYGVKDMRITAPGGTDIKIEIPKGVKFDTDCIIVKNVYGYPGKFGNLPSGEVWGEKSEMIEVLDRITGRTETKSYPVRLKADGVLVCDVCVGGIAHRLEPSEVITVEYKNGKLISFKCDNPDLHRIYDKILGSEKRYGKPTVLQEVGIGLNDKARVTGQMLEDEKIRSTSHLAAGNVRVHVDMLFDKPTIEAVYEDGSTRTIMENGVPI